MFKFFKKNDKYATISVYAVITCMTVVLLTLFVINLPFVGEFFKTYSGVFSPLLYAFIITFLCNPIVRFFENKVFRFSKEKHPMLWSAKRGFAIAATILLLLLVIVLILMMFIPTVASSYNDFAEKINDYISEAQRWVDNFIRNSALFSGKYEGLSEFISAADVSSDLQNLIGNLSSVFTTVASWIINYTGRFVTEMKNLLIGLFISIYFIASKEKLLAQGKKMLYSFFPRRLYLNIINFGRYTNRAFSGFIVGKVIDSTIIGLISFIVLGIFRMPYYPLLSVIIGITNVIPVFGPFIGGIPCALMILIAEPSKTVLFIIIILIIQQLDGNFIGPKILGDTVGISALWVLLSIVIFGGFFGFTGMLLGVPLMAIIYSLVSELIEGRLRRKNKPNDTSFYLSDPPETDFDDHTIFYSRSEVISEITADDVAPENDSDKDPHFSVLLQEKIRRLLGWLLAVLGKVWKKIAAFFGKLSGKRKKK